MEQDTYLKLCVELKDLLLRRIAKEENCDKAIIDWFGHKVMEGYKLLDLVTCYKAAMTAIDRMLSKCENLNT